MLPALPFQLCWCCVRWPRCFLPLFSPCFSPPHPLLQMPGGRCSLCHPTTASRSLPAPLGLPLCSASRGCPRSASSLPLSALRASRCHSPTSAFPNTKPTSDPGLSGSEHPRLQRGGSGSSIAAGRAPPGLLTPFAPLFLCFRMGLWMRRRCPLLGISWLEMEPKGTGGPAPRGAACAGQGSRGTDGHWEHTALVSPARPGSLGIYIIILLY